MPESPGLHVPYLTREACPMYLLHGSFLLKQIARVWRCEAVCANASHHTLMACDCDSWQVAQDMGDVHRKLS